MALIDTSDMARTWGEAIKAAMASQGDARSLRQLSLACGMAPNTISNWNVGKNAPQDASLEKIAECIGVSAMDLRRLQADEAPAAESLPVDTVTRDTLYALWSRLPTDRRSQVLVDLATYLSDNDR